MLLQAVYALMGHDAPSSTLGTCPACEQEIDSEWLLAWYIPKDEATKLLAGCPACQEIVQPVHTRGAYGHTD